MRLKDKCPCGRMDWCGLDKKPCVALIPLGHRIRLGLSLPEASPNTAVASPNRGAASPNASPNTHEASPNTGSRNSRWRAKNPEAHRTYMREYMARRRAQNRSD